MSTESSFAHHSRICRQGIIHFPLSQDYHAVLELQRELCHERFEEGRPDTLILVEHQPVFTLGRRSKPEHWGGDGASLKRMGYDVYEVERGGSVTYHGPGQIVGYPILRLRDFCPGPKVYVRMLEEVLIRVLAEWGIKGHRAEKWRGVWVYHDASPLTPTLSPGVGEGIRETPSLVSSPPFGGRGEGEGGLLSGYLRKIAAIGVRITHGVTMHGFALNVNIDLKPFELITPCGIEGCEVTSMQMVLGKSVDMAEVRKQTTRHFGEVFGLEWKA
jgi:lipoate-protein ligase B